MSTQTTTKISRKELEGKSQEELYEIARRVLELKEASKQKRLEYYLQNAHEGQVAFHKAPHRIRYVWAGNRGGKSVAGTIEHIWACLGTHPFRRNRIPLKTVIVIPDFENHGKNILEKKLDEWVPPGAIRKLERHQGGAIKKVYWTTGSTSDVLSHDQDKKVFEGADWDLAWFDEPPPHHIWKAVWRGMTDRGGGMYLTGTPLSSPWLYQKYQQIKENTDPISWYIQFPNTMNAANLGEGDKALGLRRLEELASEYDTSERDARMAGGFIQLQGLIFKDWNRDAHMIPPFQVPHSWPIFESIDPHPQKPWAVVWVARAPNGCKILLRALYVDGTIDDVANGIVMGREQLHLEQGIRPRIVRTLIDNASSVPLWSKSFTDPTARRLSVREELSNMIGPRGAGGPQVEVAPKNVQGKIDLFKRWLTIRNRDGKNRADFYVFDTDENEAFAREIELYAWDRYRSNARMDEIKPQPVKKNDDMIDAVLQVALTLGEEAAEPVMADFTGGFQGYGRKAVGGRDGRAIVEGH